MRFHTVVKRKKEFGENLLEEVNGREAADVHLIRNCFVFSCINFGQDPPRLLVRENLGRFVPLGSQFLAMAATNQS